MGIFFSDLPPSASAPIIETLEQLVADGAIGAYGWSTDFPEALDQVAGPKDFIAVEHSMNIFFDAASLSKVAEKHGLTQLIRSPLAMGVLTGKFTAGQKIPRDDIRANTFDWMDYFKGGAVNQDHLDRLDVIREILTIDGRTVGQGALGWLLAKSPSLLPIPGAKNVKQVQQNAKALEFGPLPDQAMAESENLIERADSALYTAKHNGRNQVALSAAPGQNKA